MFKLHFLTFKEIVVKIFNDAFSNSMNGQLGNANVIDEERSVNFWETF